MTVNETMNKISVPVEINDFHVIEEDHYGKVILATRLTDGKLLWVHKFHKVDSTLITKSHDAYGYRAYYAQPFKIYDGKDSNDDEIFAAIRHLLDHRGTLTKLEYVHKHAGFIVYSVYVSEID
jgi:hypothetical protein